MYSSLLLAVIVYCGGGFGSCICWYCSVMWVVIGMSVVLLVKLMRVVVVVLVMNDVGLLLWILM